jgi:dynein heavy chain 2
LEVPTLTLKEVNWAGWETLTSYFQSIAPYETEVFLSMKGNKLFEFQDFCNSWQDKLKTLEKNQQTLFIAKELELFKNIFPLLKQLSTNIFEKDHWRVFFGILKMEKDRAADKIKLREFLNVAKLMSDKANEIRELVARAQG